MLKLFDYFIYIISIIFIIFFAKRLYSSWYNPIFEYNFVPRTFQEETENPVPLNYYFEKIFSE